MSLLRVLVAAPALLVSAIGDPRALAAQARQTAAPAGTELTGTVVAATTRQPIPSASISARRASTADTAFAIRTAARSDGTFRLIGLPPGRFTVFVRALGYAPAMRAVVVPATGGTIDLGRLALAVVSRQLSAVQVQAQAAPVTFSAGSNTFATRDLPAAAGGTALDVLRHVPQVEVDGANNVSLRGSTNVVVQINGRPTPLKGQDLSDYLAQFPANLVAKVAVVTNPSAKNDPDGTAGIINIILVQQTSLGTSRAFSASAATTKLAAVSGNVGRQQGRWTGFASYGASREERGSLGTADQVDASGAAPTTLSAIVTGRVRPISQSATLRGEYKLRTQDAVAADVVFNTGAFTRSNDAAYVAADAEGAVQARYAQLTTSRYSSTIGDYALAWRHTVDPEKDAASLELRLNDAHNAFQGLTDPRTSLQNPGLGLAGPTKNLNRRHTPTIRLQGDWTRAIGGDTKLELGGLGIRRRTSSTSETQVEAMTGPTVVQPADASAYDEAVSSLYGVVTRKAGALLLQGGLRLEQATTRFDLASSTTTGGQRYVNDYKSAFPSMLVAYSFASSQQVKASYSRRVSRPDPAQLNPYAEREDAFNILQGNPALRPEYTNSYELGYQRAFGRGSVQLTPYYRRTPNSIRLLRTVDAGGIRRSTFANVALTQSYGTDLNLSLRAGRWTALGGGSVFGMATDARNVAPNVSFRASAWTARANGTYKLTPALDLQAFVLYRSPQAVEGARIERFALTTFALRQKLGLDRGSLTLSVQDPFNSVSYRVRTVNGALVQSTDQHYGLRSLRVGYSYTLGKPPQLRPQGNDPGAPQGSGAGGGPPG